MKLLPKIRRVLAVLVLLAVTLLFLDFTGALRHWLGWLAKIQFLPAVLALNLVIVAVLVLFTLVLGRSYCSIICPLGIFQDGVSWLSGQRDKRRKRLRFSYKKEIKWLRYGVLALFVVAIILGINAFVAILAPYSAYGRIVTNLFQPVYRWGNNLLATIAANHESYAFFTKDVWLKSLPTFIIAAVTFVILVILAWKGGRTYCNSVCPVGTTLSIFSRFAMFRPVIDSDKCKNCHICERGCKASCINIAEHKIDYSRCVDCFNCLENCKFNALEYKFAWGGKAKGASAPAVNPEDPGRRAFLASGALLATALTVEAQEKKVDGGLAVLEDKQLPDRKVSLKPAGAKSLKNFSSRCTGCQLCVSECPGKVLRPSKGLQTLLQPEMAFDRGYCRPDCTRCSEVCPTGAIEPIDMAMRSATSIGYAVTVPHNCLLAQGVECNACSRHCPTAAISLVSDAATGHSIVTVNEMRCIGCGACEHYCPVRPFSAIYVEGREVHVKI